VKRKLLKKGKGGSEKFKKKGLALEPQKT